MRLAPWSLTLLISASALARCGDDQPCPTGDEAEPQRPISCEATADECTGHTICIQGSCRAAFPRTYALRVESAVIAPTRPDGTDWESELFNNTPGPDPYILVLVGTETRGGFAKQPETFEPSWSDTVTLALETCEPVLLSMRDADDDPDDILLQCQAMPSLLHGLRRRGWTCNHYGTRLDVTIEPIPSM